MPAGFARPFWPAYYTVNVHGGSEVPRTCTALATPATFR